MSGGLGEVREKTPLPRQMSLLLLHALRGVPWEPIGSTPYGA